MTKHKKTFTRWQIEERERVERELSQIKPMSPALRKLTSPRGFADYFMQMRGLYNTDEETYERLEEYHIAVTGRRKYSEFDSFRLSGLMNR